MITVSSYLQIFIIILHSISYSNLVFWLEMILGMKKLSFQIQIQGRKLHNSKQKEVSFLLSSTIFQGK